MSEKKEKTLFIVSDEYVTAIYTDTCLSRFPHLTNFWGGIDIVHNKEHYLLTEEKSSYLYRIHGGRPKKEIAWIYRKRFGRVLRTTLVMENGTLYFCRELVGPSKKLKTDYFTMSFEKKRPYIEGETLWDFFQKLSDPNMIKKELEIFVGSVLEQFKTQTNGILDNRCYDVAMANTIRERTGKYRFFDFEFKMNKGVPPSYLVYRIIRNSCFKEEDKRGLYSHLCRKYQLQDTYDFWDVFHDVSEEGMLSPPPTKIMLSVSSCQREYLFMLFISLHS